jgi:hypothetical protein
MLSRIKLSKSQTAEHDGTKNGVSTRKSRTHQSWQYEILRVEAFEGDHHMRVWIALGRISVGCIVRGWARPRAIFF